MLIQTAIDLIYDRITALSWVEYYGSVAQVYTETKETENGYTQKRLPISCNANQANCNNNQRYQDLLPDSSKKSVLFWEVQRGLSFANNSNNNQRQQIWNGSARLIGWLNTAKLGVNQCNVAGAAIRSLMPILTTISPINTQDATNPLYGCQVEIKILNEVPKDPNIWSKYTMPDNNGWNLYPFDYFALDCQIKILIPITCEFDFNDGAEIPCPSDLPL